MPVIRHSAKQTGHEGADFSKKPFHFNSNINWSRFHNLLQTWVMCILSSKTTYYPYQLLHRPVLCYTCYYVVPYSFVVRRILVEQEKHANFPCSNYISQGHEPPCRTTRLLGCTVHKHNYYVVIMLRLVISSIPNYNHVARIVIVVLKKYIHSRGFRGRGCLRPPNFVAKF